MPQVTSLVQGFTASLVERGENLVMHWCRAFIFQELHSQDWDEAQRPFVEDRRCSYGVQAWSLFLRGLIFDFKPGESHIRHASLYVPVPIKGMMAGDHVA